MFYVCIIVSCASVHAPPGNHPGACINYGDREEHFLMTLTGSTAVERESSMMVQLLGHINVSYMNEELHAHVLLGLVSAVNRPLQPIWQASRQVCTPNFGALGIKGLVSPNIALIATQSQRHS